MFTSLAPNFANPWKSIRYQCPCGNQYTLATSTPPAPNTGCPACGRLVPRAVSTDGGPWLSQREWKITCLRRMLEPAALDEMPAEYREPARQSIQRQIRQFEDGTWKSEYKKRIQTLRQMTQHSDRLNDLPADAREKMLASTAAHLKTLQEELEAAGEKIDDNNPPAKQYWTGKFTPPTVTTREWEEDPMQVVQKVSFAIALHIQPQDMTILQRHLVHLHHYFHAISPGAGGHGEIFLNASQDYDGPKFIREALQSVCTPAHVAVFQKAEDQWHAKSRDYPQTPSGDRRKLAEWVEQTFRPMQAEFRDVDQEALRVQPTLESLIIALLRQHRDELVNVVDQL